MNEKVSGKIRHLLRSKFFLIILSLVLSCLIKTLVNFDLEASDSLFRPAPVPEFLKETGFGEIDEAPLFFRR